MTRRNGQIQEDFLEEGAINLTLKEKSVGIHRHSGHSRGYLGQL